MDKQLEIEKVNGKRELLQYKLPLEVPYALTVMVSNICNLACEYCDCSIKGRKGNKPLLDFKDYRKVIDSMEKEWVIKKNTRIKQLTLVGLGEPLLHKEIDKFVSYAKEHKVANSVQVVTNGTFLTKEMSDKLIQADLDVLKISINGLSREDYGKYAGKEIDFESLVEKIRYFYINKKNTKVYIKIMKHMVNTKELEDKFYFLFKDIADVVNIEQLADLSFEIDSKEVADLSNSVGIKGYEMQRTDICSMPFYSFVLNAEGTISACCLAGAFQVPPRLVMGESEDVDSIWNGKLFNEFRIKMLQYGVKGASEECAKCTGYKAMVYPEDIIDEEKQNILTKIQKNCMGNYR